jgi:lipoate-protein ligase A
MRRWLSQISLWVDEMPHAAALNMAIDEALLGIISGPVLRIYQWVAPSVSFGYFERWGPVRAAHPDRDAVRRWTGGGVVLHGEDFTYSLLIPRASGSGTRAPAESYAIIHGALSRAMGEAGIPAMAAPWKGEKISQACFENPVMHDVMAGGRKVAGGAQRRTRTGLIHQGSVQSLDLPAGFSGSFAAQLGQSVEVADFEIPVTAYTLAVEKYSTAAWMERL